MPKTFCRWGFQSWWGIFLLMKKEKSLPKQKALKQESAIALHPKIKREIHWVIQVKDKEPFYYKGNERKADGARMYHGVKHSTIAWKRLALPDEILMRSAIRGILKGENVYTQRSERKNYIKEHFPDATDEEIQSARLAADKHIQRNTKISESHKLKTQQIHARNPQPILRNQKKKNN